VELILHKQVLAISKSNHANKDRPIDSLSKCAILAPETVNGGNWEAALNRCLTQAEQIRTEIYSIHSALQILFPLIPLKFETTVSASLTKKEIRGWIHSVLGKQLPSSRLPTHNTHPICARFLNRLSEIFRVGVKGQTKLKFEIKDYRLESQPNAEPKEKRTKRSKGTILSENTPFDEVEAFLEKECEELTAALEETRKHLQKVRELKAQSSAVGAWEETKKRKHQRDTASSNPSSSDAEEESGKSSDSDEPKFE